MKETDGGETIDKQNSAKTKERLESTDLGSYAE